MLRCSCGSAISFPTTGSLPVKRSRYHGEPVAIVLAETPYAAYDAARLVDVDYVDLPPAMSAAEALRPDAPVVHEHRYGRDPATSGDLAGDLSGRHPNVAHQIDLRWGGPAAALAAAAIVVETTARYPMLYAYAMEPYNAVAVVRDGRLEVTSPAQHPFQVARDLARVSGMPLSHVSVKVPYIGGGHGNLAGETNMDQAAEKLGIGPGRGQVVGTGAVRRADRFGQPPAFREIRMVGVQVAVDPDTGQVAVEHLVTVADAGKAGGQGGLRC
jgi:CO/xanthine dehydrogenase Mo-binding subunit